MENMNEENSLLDKLEFEDENMSILPESDNVQENSLLDVDTFNTASNIVDFNKMSEAEERESRRLFFMNPENQAVILYENFINSHPDMILSGKQKRNLRREFLRNAKKGKYKSLFMKQVDRVPNKEAFSAVNG